MDYPAELNKLKLEIRELKRQNAGLTATLASISHRILEQLKSLDGITATELAILLDLGNTGTMGGTIDRAHRIIPTYRLVNHYMPDADSFFDSLINEINTP